MDEFHRGSDIPFTITGGSGFDLDKNDFEVWHYIYTNAIHKLPKSSMKRIEKNTYEGVIRRDFTAGMGIGYATVEIRILDVSHGTVEIVSEERRFHIKKSIIGG